ncbi:MAG TPA: Cof-type HAD-IIB family hydrolase [Pseudogracilibacillus sp.]|nr:Cof-type HAD-IIB family hydrolase [Pseudogracilibacillus sp.]
MKKHLLVTDLDGTLLNSDHKISEYNYNQIKKFQQQGGLFTFATGRMNETVHPFIHELDITIPVITYNGVQIFCPVEKKVLYEKSFTLSKAMYDQLVETSTTLVEVLLFFNHQACTVRKGPLIKEFEQKEKVSCRVMELDYNPETVTKIIFLSKERNKLEDLKIFFEKTFDGISVVFSETNYLEILPENASKGEALKEMKKHCALTDVNTVGFGNNLNDISLLQTVNIGVAVKNAVDGLLGVADHISRYSNNEGAVGQYIESLLNTSR